MSHKLKSLMITNPQNHVLQKYIKEGAEIIGVSLFIKMHDQVFEILPMGDSVPSDIDIEDINNHFNKQAI